VAATLTKGAENTFRYTINDATMQLLYVPVPTHQRGRAKAFIDGILKPVAIGLSGLLILALSRGLGEEGLARDLAFIDLGLLVAWLLLVFSIRSEYVRSLLETLRSRRLNMDGSWMLSTDDTTRKALKSALTSTNEADVIHALELVKGIDIDLGEHVPNLLDHPSEVVRTTTLRLLERKPDLRKLRMIESRLKDPADEVRGAAVAAYCAISGAQALRAVLPALEDPSATVRAAAVAGLIRYGGIDGVLAAAETLKKLLSDEDQDARAIGARVLADIQVQSFYQPLLDLLEDRSVKVRLAAIEAAGTMGSPELVPRLLQKLKVRETARAATRALVAYGDTVEPVLLSVLKNREEDIEIRRRIPDILARIGGPKAFSVIMRQLRSGDRRFRTALAKAAGRMRERVPHLDLDVELLSDIMTDEIRAAYQDLAVMEDLGMTPESLLGEALWVRSRRRIGLIFRLLEIRYPPRTIQLIYTNLYSENKAIRANALELADNILSGEESRLLLPLLESASIHDTLIQGQSLFELTRAPRRDRLEELLGDSESWLVSAALWEVRESQETDLVARSLALFASEDPLVRETTGVSLQALAPSVRDEPLRARMQTQAQRLGQDSVPRVRAAAEGLLAALRTTPA
jgi:HEAT repeat protein